MDRQQHIDLLAERRAIERMIAETPDENVLDRSSLVNRLRAVDKELAAAGPIEPEPQPIEERHELVGQLEGVLPFGREFEFRIAATGESIWGTIGPEVEHPAALNSLLLQPSRIHVTVTRVGNGRPRYVLIAPPESPPPAK